MVLLMSTTVDPDDTVRRGVFAEPLRDVMNFLASVG